MKPGLPGTPERPRGAAGAEQTNPRNMPLMQAFTKHFSARPYGLVLLIALLGLASAPLAAQVVGGDVDVLKTKVGDSGLDLFGGAVCGPGDLDGDGVPDYVVGARDAMSKGEIYAFSGADHSELWYERGEGFTDWFGYSLAAIEDVDGDGVMEIAVSAIYFDNGLATNAGKVYLLSGADGSEIWSYASSTAYREFGEALAAAGDVDGDGYEDVVAGMPYADSATYSNAGKITVLDGLTGNFMFQEYGSGNEKHFGTGVAGVGDLNHDGYDDIVVGVPGHSTSSLTGAGRLTILSGRYVSGNGGAHYIALVDGTYDGGALGTSVARIGDVDLDGTSDILAGAPLADVAGHADAGLAILFSGDTRGTLDFMWGDFEDGAHFGLDVASAGDVDHDGVPDIVVGAPFSDLGFGTDSGMIYVYSGRTEELIFGHEGEEYEGEWGTCVAGLGDLNGDGTSEVIAGAPEADWNSTDDGYAQILTLLPYLTISKLTASVSGDTVEFMMNFDWYHSGEQYQILVSGTGDGPTAIGGIDVPLTSDARLTATLAGSYPRSASDFTGTLDGYGQATGVLSFTSLPAGLIGKTFFFATVVGSGGTFDASSIVQTLDYVP